MEEKNEYESKAEKFLANTKTSFKAEFLRFDKYFPEDEQKRAIFTITLSRGERVFSFTFGQSVANSGFCFPKYINELNPHERLSFNDAWKVA